LDNNGRPLPVKQTIIRPPGSRIGALDDDERQNCMERSPLRGRYEEPVDRISAYEILKDRAREAQVQRGMVEAEKTKNKPKAGSKKQSTGEAFIKSAVRTIGSQVGRQIVRGIMGSLFGGRR